MKQPLMFKRLLSVWMAMPKLLDRGIAKGFAGREPQAGWMRLNGLSAISEVLPPQAYADLGWAQVYNKAVRKFRRRGRVQRIRVGDQPSRTGSTARNLRTIDASINSAGEQQFNGCAAT